MYGYLRLTTVVEVDSTNCAAMTDRRALKALESVVSEVLVSDCCTSAI